MMMLLMTPVKSARQPQYGLDSIEGFCEGWGELDQLSDISSQVLYAKYPYMGSIRVSWWNFKLFILIIYYNNAIVIAYTILVLKQA